MSTDTAAPELTHAVRTQIFEALRLGTVPDQGLDAIADLDPRVDDAINRFLEAPSGAGGALRVLRGDPGAGKTFSLKLAAQRARAHGFVTTIAVLNEQSVGLHHAERLYRAWMAGLHTEGSHGGALLDIVDRWVFRVGEQLTRADGAQGADAGESLLNALEHDMVRRGIGAQLPEFRSALLGLVRARLINDTDQVWGLHSWIGGSDNVGARVLRSAGIRGRLGADDIEHALRDLTRLADAAGLAGVFFGVDELASVLRCERDQREKSWDMLLRIVDVWRTWPNTAFLLSATHEVFDSPRGVVSLEPLNQRISRVVVDGVESGRQVQIGLVAMDDERLIRIARRLVRLYPTTDPARLSMLESDDALRSIIARIGGQAGAGVQPRRYLRAICEVLDAIDSGTLRSLDAFSPADEPAEPVVPPLPTAAVRW